MRTFTFSDDKSHKFWNIDLQGTSFTVTYGRLGTAGQAQAKSFPTEAAAKKEYEKLVAEKTKKGYRETTAAAKPAPASLRDSLEQSLVENPDDLTSSMAYADYLTEQGDPFGEFVRVQLALEDPSRSAADRKKLQKQEDALLKKHQEAWLGELAPFLINPKKHQYEWQTISSNFRFVRGWLDTLEVKNYSVEFSRAMAQSPQLRLLDQLILNNNAYEERGEYAPGDDIPEHAENPQLYPLLRCPYLGNVRTFVVGGVMTPEEENEAVNGGFSCHTQGDGAVGIVKQMPKLEELRLLCHNVDAEQLYALRTLNNLRVLQHYHGMSYPFAHLAKNSSLGNLTHLLCHPHAIEEDPIIRLPAVRTLVRSTELRSLTHLRLRCSDMGDKGVQEIISSGILRQLKMLDLRHGCITDDGAALAACPELKNLELLDLIHNSMTEEGIRALQRTGVNLAANNQWSLTDNNEYEDFGGPGYLYAGDIE